MRIKEKLNIIKAGYNGESHVITDSIDIRGYTLSIQHDISLDNNRFSLNLFSPDKTLISGGDIDINSLSYEVETCLYLNDITVIPLWDNDSFIQIYSTKNMYFKIHDLCCKITRKDTKRAVQLLKIVMKDYNKMKKLYKHGASLILKLKPYTTL